MELKELIESLKNDYKLEVFNKIKISEKWVAEYVLTRGANLKMYFIPGKPPRMEGIIYTEHIKFCESVTVIFFDNGSFFNIDFQNHHGEGTLVDINFLRNALMLENDESDFQIVNDCSDLLEKIWYFFMRILPDKTTYNTLEDIVRYLKVMQLVGPNKKQPFLLCNYIWTETKEDSELIEKYGNKSSRAGNFKNEVEILFSPTNNKQDISLRHFDQLLIEHKITGPFWQDKVTKQYSGWDSIYLFRVAYSWGDAETGSYANACKVNEKQIDMTFEKLTELIKEGKVNSDF